MKPNFVKIGMISAVAILICGLILLYVFSFNLKWKLLHLAFLFHFLLLYLSLKSDKNIINPLNLFLATVMFLYLLKFLLIEGFENVNLRFVNFPKDRYDALYIKSIAFICLGSLFFYLGYSCKIFDNFIKRIPKIRFKKTNIKSLNFFMILLIVIGTIAMINLIYLKGGLISAISKMAFYRTHSPEQTPNFMYVLMTYLPLGAVIGIIFYMSWFWQRKNLFARLMLLMCLILISFLLYIATGSRFQSIAPIFSFLVIYKLQKKKLKIRSFIPVFLAMIVVISIMGIFRDISRSKSAKYIFVKRVNYHMNNLAWSVGYNLNGPSGLMSILHIVPKRIKPSYGFTFIQAFITMFPRTLIPFFKGRETIGNFIAQIVAPVRFEKGGGFAPSIYGMFYLNFMLPGIILLSFLFGIFSHSIYEYSVFNLSNFQVFNFTFYSIIFIYGFLEFFRSGDIIKISNNVFSLLLLFILAVLFSRIFPLRLE